VGTSEKKIFACPYEGCDKAYTDLANLFQHISKAGHELTERFLIIDRVAGTVKVMTARSAPAELKEPQEVTA
jgi:hypothetical protein